jgi:hypothetical protein
MSPRPSLLAGLAAVALSFGIVTAAWAAPYHSVARPSMVGGAAPGPRGAVGGPVTIRTGVVGGPLRVTGQAGVFGPRKGSKPGAKRP